MHDPQTETQNMEEEVHKTMDSAPQFSKMVAVVHPTEGNQVSGTVTFTKTADGVQVQGTISGLAEGKHGFHIHQYGDCTASDGTSAGGHYNPAGSEHAAPSDSARHMGDMGNIEADAEGNATVDYLDPVIELDKIRGRAVILHGGEDDLSSQPSGAAGPRKACGVIGIANTGN
ncbi:superoxide dismutase family protein [Aliifodinibius sp. 1BSP15-2V2]|uniref:Superoxide dismutase family protein n=2 Tax=Fodinibius salsisoli TaxID=2820877 RepID=A0ABT3PJ90_9BACT|nr:superoxide dismutase family protein [Fodinibius salsisoli]